MSDAFALIYPGPAKARGYDVGAVATPAPSWAGAGGRSLDDSGPMRDAFVEKVIDRLEEIVEAETQALRNRTRVDLNDFNHRKSQALLELSRATRQGDGASLGEPLRARLSGLRARLETNRAVLSLHLEAVREISSIVAETIRQAESDGTYTLSVRSQKRP